MKAISTSRVYWAKQQHVRNGERVNLRKGLQAYWKLDEEVDSVRLDSSENGLHLYDVNSVTQEAGRIGNAAGFAYDGFDRWLDRPDDPRLRFDSDFTISCWIYRTGYAFDTDTILNKEGGLYFYSHAGWDYHLLLVAQDNASNEVLFLVGDEAIEMSQWYHAVIFRKAHTFCILLNNRVSALVHGVMGNIGQGGNFRIGTHEGGYPFTGNIDEVGKWNRALNSSEIAALYNSGNGLRFEDF